MRWPRIELNRGTGLQSLLNMEPRSDIRGGHAVAAFGFSLPLI